MAGRPRAGAVPAPITDDGRGWDESPLYRRGVSLFNAGYYWEAHEAWEGLWHAHGRRGPTAEVLKGLIKLAAAGVKVRQGQRHGVCTHTARAARIFESVREQVGNRWLGLDLPDLIAYAHVAGDRPGVGAPRPATARCPRRAAPSADSPVSKPKIRQNHPDLCRATSTPEIRLRNSLISIRFRLHPRTSGTKTPTPDLPFASAPLNQTAGRPEGSGRRIGGMDETGLVRRSGCGRRGSGAIRPPRRQPGPPSRRP